MQRRRKLLAAGLGATAAVSIAVGGAFAATSAPKVDHLVIRSGTHVKPGYWIRDDLRYTPFASSVRSGGTISIKGASGAFSEGPHTFSLVRKSQLPTSLAEAFNCDACNQALDAHFGTGGPPVTRVNVGQPGLDQPSDSLLLLDGERIGAAISAPSGTNLYYLCAIHPWMQGKLSVG